MCLPETYFWKWMLKHKFCHAGEDNFKGDESKPAEAEVSDCMISLYSI